MKQTNEKQNLLCVLLAGALALGGCSIVPEPKADPTRHYVLATYAGDGERAAAAAIPAGKPVIGLRTVELPAYLLARKSIAVRQGRNEIVYHEYARWAEPLEDGIQRIVSERLLSSGAISGIALLPGRAARSYDLIIRVLECEGAGSSVHFVAEYELSAPGGAIIGGTRKFVAPAVAWDGKDFAALAKALGDAVTALAADIAKNVPAN